MMVKLKGPANHGGFSHAGQSYQPDKEGLIEVPHAAVEPAMSHGFSLHHPAPTPEPKKKPEPTPEPAKEPEATPEPTSETKTDAEGAEAQKEETDPENADEESAKAGKAGKAGKSKK